MKNIEQNKNLNQVSFQGISYGTSGSQEITESIYKFIRNNKSLLHLDISYLGLSPEELYIVAKACSKCRTLLAIHLTGNRKVEDLVVKARIRKIMRPRKRIKDFHEDHDAAYDSDEQGILTEATTEKMLQKIPKAQKTQSTRFPKEHKTVLNETKDDKLIYTRVLGHFEMPNSHRWVETTSCWFCEKHIYTLVLASKSICEQCYTKPRKKEPKKYIKKI